MPETDWSAAMRPSFTSFESAPYASLIACWANSGSPPIGAYSLFICASCTRLAASWTDLMTTGLLLSSR